MREVTQKRLSGIEIRSHREQLQEMEVHSRNMRGEPSKAHMGKSNKRFSLRIRTIELQRNGILLLKGKDFFISGGRPPKSKRTQAFLNGLFQQRLKSN